MKTWHLEAQRLYAKGLRVVDISRRLNKAYSLVRWSIDVQSEKDKQRERVRNRRAGLDTSVLSLKDDAPQRPVSLPAVKAAPAPATPALRFAPKSEVKITGADRWRAAADKMRRRGYLSGADLVSEIGQ